MIWDRTADPNVVAHLAVEAERGASTVVSLADLGARLAHIDGELGKIRGEIVASNSNTMRTAYIASCQISLVVSLLSASTLILLLDKLRVLQ